MRLFNRKFLAALLAAALFSSCTTQEQIDAEIKVPVLENGAAVAYKTAVVEEKDIETTANVGGSIGYFYSDDLFLHEQSNVIEIVAKRGDVLKEGDVIAVFDSSSLDYDYNAPNEAHLAATHEKMYQKIRSAQPDLPIIFMSLPKRTPLEEATRQRRLEIIRQTYVNAVASGDGNVYLIPGEELLGDCAEMATVDNCHPNDLGFYMMAQALKPILSRLLRKE